MVKSTNQHDRMSILYISLFLFIHAFFGNVLSLGQIAFITIFLFMTILITFVIVITQQTKSKNVTKIEAILFAQINANNFIKTHYSICAIIQ